MEIDINTEVFAIAQRLYGCVTLVRECEANGNNPPPVLQEQLISAAEELANTVIEMFVEPECRRSEDNEFSEENGDRR